MTDQSQPPNAASGTEEPSCCCQPYDPQAHLIIRCFTRAMDLGHCTPDDFDKSFCCGGELSALAKVNAVVAARLPDTNVKGVNR